MIRHFLSYRLPHTESSTSVSLKAALIIAKSFKAWPCQIKQKSLIVLWVIGMMLLGLIASISYADNTSQSQLITIQQPKKAGHPQLASQDDPVTQPTRLLLVTEEVPPLQIQMNNQAKGYVVEFVQEIIQEANKYHPIAVDDIHFTPWKRALAKTEKEANILLFSIARIPTREEKFHWLGQVSPYEVILYRHKSGPDITASSLEELNQYRLGCQSGSNFEYFFSQKGFQPDTVSYNRQTIKMLKMGRIDLAPQVSNSFFYRLEEMGENPEDYIPVIRVDELSKQLWLVTGKNTDLEVVTALQTAYNTLNQAGRLQALRQAYQPNSDVMKSYRVSKQSTAY